MGPAQAPGGPQQPFQELRERLTTLLESRLGGTIELRGLERLTGGANRETWAVEALHDGRLRELILQRPPAGGEADDGLALQALACRAAARQGVPVPLVLDAGGPDSEMGFGFVLSERVHGEALASRILRDDAFATVRPTLAASCGEILARLHSVPPSEVPGLSRPDPLRLLRELLDRFAEPSPAFELALRRLGQDPPEPTPDAVVHGDFRNGNMVVGATGIAAVLDWEEVHLGDPDERPRLVVRAGMALRGRRARRRLRRDRRSARRLRARRRAPRRSSRGAVVGAVGHRPLGARLHADGRAPPERRRTVDRAGRDRPSRVGAGVRRAAAARRGRRKAAMTRERGVPNAQELVRAVREMLAADVRPATERRLRFNVRVAENVLAAVERELAVDGAHAEQHARELTRLGAADDAELAAAIRQGRLDGRADELLAILHRRAVRRLSISNPRHLRSEDAGALTPKEPANEL
jgi:aminoglycoside phosphotransferase (APT) family kinase protein